MSRKKDRHNKRERDIKPHLLVKLLYVVLEGEAKIQ